MKRPRVTVRLAMAVVAIIAIPLTFWARAMDSRRQSYLKDVAFHERREREEFQNSDALLRFQREGTANDPSMLKVEMASRLRVPYHAALKRKYLRAAARPWETVDPDPRDPGEDLVWQSMYSEPVDFPDLNGMMKKVEEAFRRLK